MSSRISIAAIIIATSATLSHGQITLSELDSVRASDGALRDHYGSKVAVSGNTLLVASFDNDEGGENSGAVYIYDLTTKAELFKIIGSDTVGGDHFGCGIDVSGNIAIIGAYTHDTNGDNSRGAAYLFDITTGQELFKLIAPDGEPSDFFGLNVAIDGDYAIVGSTGNDERGWLSGAAYLFDVSTGQLIRKFTATETSSADKFGRSIAISGNIGVVGANYVDDDRGALYVFDLPTGNELHKLTADDADPGDQLGWNVAISGTTVVAGTIYDEPRSGWLGSAYIFNASTGQQVHKVYPNDPSINFGNAVAVSGNRALIGASREFDDRNGAAYYFDTTTGEQQFQLVASGLSRHANLGESVAFDGDNAILGAWNSEEFGESGVGSVYFYDADAECLADTIQDGSLNYLDISNFLALFMAQDPSVDLNDDSMFNFLDVSAFVDLVNNNCN